MRDISIDIIRAISMIYVIAIWHLSNYTQTFSLEGTFPYCITVAIMGTFMFVSGFLLKGKYNITGKDDVINFFKKRFIRIIPLYILAASYYVMVGDMPSTICFWIFHFHSAYDKYSLVCGNDYLVLFIISTFME